MSTTNSISIRYFAICLATAIAAMAYLSLPFFEANRALVVSQLKIDPTMLAILVGAIVVIVFLLALYRFQQTVSSPLVGLLKEAETNRLNGAYSPKAKIMEIGRFRYLLENRALVTAEMEEQIDELESRVKTLEEELKASEKQSEDRRRDISEKTKQLEELRYERIQLEDNCNRLKSDLEQHRRADVGEEVARRSDEIYAQMEKAVEATAYKSLWFPKTIGDLKTPAMVIQKTANALAKNWELSTFARLKSDIEELKEQSDRQIALLNQLTGDDPSANDANRSEEEPSDKVSLRLAENGDAVPLEAESNPPPENLASQ